jgi:hypothetical protein
MRPGKPPVAKKRKHSSSSSDSEDLTTKRAKHVTTSVPADVTMAGTGTGTHVAATPPPPVVPVVHVVPVGPHLVASTGRGPNAVSDIVFNTTHKITFPPLTNAAAEVRKDRKSKRKSEKLGEQGAVAYVQAHTGYGDVGLHEATPTDPHTLVATPGQRWSHAVAFNGAHVADITFWDGAQLHVVEAKGGGSQLGARNQSRFHKDTSGADLMKTLPPAVQNNTGSMNNLSTVLKGKNFTAGDLIPNAVKQYVPNRLPQGTLPYLTDIGHAMANSPKGDGRALVGGAIIAQGNNVHYQPVSTQAPLDGTGVDVHTM